MTDALHDRRVQIAALALAITALVGRFLDPTVGIIVLVGIVPGLMNAPRADHYDSSLELAALPAALGTVGYGLVVVGLRLTGEYQTPTTTPLHLAVNYLGPIIEVLMWGPLWVVEAILAFVVVRRFVRD